MTTEFDVVAAVVAALDPLKASIDAKVAEPGDLATQPDGYPMLKVRLVSETKQGLGRHSVGFTTTVTVRVVGEVAEPVDAADDILVATITAKLVDLKRAYERAVIGNPALTRITQQLASVSSQFSYDVQATRLAGIQSDFAYELFQDGADFFPFDLDDLEKIVVIDPHHPGVGLDVHLA